MKRLLAILCVLAMLLGVLPVVSFAVTAAESVDFAVLSTTDMHGKCWDVNVLTDGTESNNMLRVATAVKGFRAGYGENMLVIDNGDLYQGTPVSVVQLNKITTGESDLPAAMALCLAEIGYDMGVLGNHEFNYPWSTMRGIYDYLESRGVPTVTANLYYDGTDGIHEAGENVFTPYLVKTVTINGNEHKIGVLGFENTDCTRWDVPDNYPGIVFAHPDNPERSMAWEAQRYIPMMQAEGCEFIIVSYHSGTGSTAGELVFGVNTEGQVNRLIAECEGIDMVIAGHDHSSSYSNTYLNDKNGKPVLVVNGGGKDLTQSIFTFSEDGEGKLAYTVKQTKNLSLGGYQSDADLKAKLQPYADMAIEYVNQTAGTAIGTWDTSSNYYLQQTDTMDLINCAQIAYGSKYMAKKYDTDEKREALYAATGLDHTDVDVSSTSAVTNNNYYVKPGPITMKTIVQMYKYDNNVLYLLPLTGQQIKDILEQNAATRLKAIVKNGKVTYSTIGEDFTNPIFGGLNFTYDMYQPEGSRVIIEGFSNGREFEPEKTYIVACNSYHLGNTGCGFGAYTTTDSIWNQNDDLAGGNVQEVLFDYISEQGEITTLPFRWHWKLDYTGDLDAPTALAGDLVAKKTDTLNVGDQIVIYYDAEATVIGQDPAENDARLSAVETTSYKDYIAFSDKAAVFTVYGHYDEEHEDSFLLLSDKGALTAGETGNSLGFTENATDCSAWYLVPVEGGYHIMNVGANYNGNYNQALEWYTGFTTYGVKDTPAYLFNIYSLVDSGRLAETVEDGKQYAIYFDQDELCVGSSENSGGLSTVRNDVSGDFLLLPIDEDTLVVTANYVDEDKIDFTTADGKHLTAPLTGNGLSLTDELAADDCSLWTPVPVEGGWHVMSVGAAYNGNHNQALEYYSGKFTTYGVKDTGAYLFNFYELSDAGETPPEPEAYDVWVGGVQVTEANAADVFGDGKVRFTPAEGEDPAVIELNNYSYTGEGSLVFIGDKSVVSAVFYNEEAPVEVRLTGENTLVLEDREELPYNAIAMFLRTADTAIIGSDGASLSASCGTAEIVSAPVAGKGDLRIEGVKLTASNPESEQFSYGVYAGKGLTVASSELHVEAGKAELCSYGVYSLDGELVIEDCKLEVITDLAKHSIAVNSGDQKLTIRGSELTATSGEGVSGSYALHSQKSVIEIENSTVKATAGKAEFRSDAVYAGNSVSISGSQVEACGGGAKFSMGFAIFTEGVTIQNSTVHAEGGAAASQSAGIYVETDITISDDSTVEAIGKEATDAEGASGGFLAFGTVTVEDSAVLATAETAFECYGICGYNFIDEAPDGSVIVKNSTVTATAGEGTYCYGICTNVLEIAADVSAVEASGAVSAVKGKVVNAVPGTGWDNVDGTGDGTAIPVNGEGAELTGFKLVRFEKKTENPFEDVEEGKFYYDAVLWAVSHEPQITNGVDNTHFAPGNDCTRGQVVTFLWRAHGCPEPTQTDNPFEDVEEGKFYYKAVLWAVENNITKGIDDTHFGPDSSCTRGQVVTFLWRAAGEPAATGSDEVIVPGENETPIVPLDPDEPAEPECAFEDVNPEAYYYQAMLWAVANGITKGTSDTTFAPGNTCTRGQVVTFLYRAK